MLNSCTSVIFILLLLLIVCLAPAEGAHDISSSLSSLAKTRETERGALLRTGWWGDQIPLFNNTIFKHHCNWTGIDCSKAGKVVSIILAGIQINDELGKLDFSIFPYLQVLDLSYCQLTGTIPYQIRMLLKLDYLSLTVNNLTGKLPSSLVNLTHLQLLDVSRNDLSGPIPSGISNIKNLLSLNLQHNKLTGYIPWELGNLSNLVYLYIRDNNLTGAIPSTLSSLTKLDTLDLHYNIFTGELPSSLANLTRLKILDVSYNHLSGFNPFELGKLSNLFSLDLQQNQLTGTIPSALGSLTNLNHLNLSFNQFSGSLDFQQANLFKLLDLDVSHNFLIGSIPVFENCSSLQLLDLSNNLLSGYIPDELGDCSSLDQVSLNNNNFSGRIPNKVRCLLHLNYLDLTYNNFYDAIPPTKYQYVRSQLCRSSDNNLNAGDLTSHRGKSVLHVLYIVLPLAIGLPLIILAFVFFRRHTTIEYQNRTTLRNGDMCSIWNFDGNIAYEDIIRATNNFDIKYCIGTGGYGSVYEARLPSGNIVALKKLHRLEGEEPTSDRSFRNEVHNLSNIRHKNIVKLYGFC